MMRRFFLFSIVLLLFGCTGRSDSATSPPDVPALVARLETLHSTIKDQFTSEEPPNIHEHMHEVGGILSKLSGVDDSTPISIEARTEIHNAAQDMLAAYGDVDGAIHEGEQPDYESVSDRLDEDMQRLKDAISPAASTVSAEPSDSAKPRAPDRS